jgi:hypothetical protein
MAENLPPLPEAYTRDWAAQVPIKLYTEGQMKAYAAEAVKVERQACAEICHNEAIINTAEAHQYMTDSPDVSLVWHARAKAAKDCASAITNEARNG